MSVEAARRESKHLVSQAPASLQAPLVTSLVTLHRVLSSTTALDPSLEHLRRRCRRAGRRLENLLDAFAGGSTSTSALLTSFVEPDLLPLLDATALFLGPALRASDDEGSVRVVADAVIAVVEEDLGPAVLAVAGFSFEVPRPQVTVFDPRRHQLLERGAGAKDVVVEVHRFGRVGRGNRLLEPALVVVGDGPGGSR